MSLEEELNKDMIESGWTKCPKCGGCGTIESLKNISLGTCWRCNGTGSIPKIEEVRGLVFEAMVSDSVNLRQKCIWDFSIAELQEAIDAQNKNFENSINEGIESNDIIEEYKGHLKRFKEWSKYFMMEAKVLKGHE